MNRSLFIFLYLFQVTSPIISWAVVRHAYVIRVTCVVTTNISRPDVIDINLHNAVRQYSIFYSIFKMSFGTLMILWSFLDLVKTLNVYFKGTNFKVRYYETYFRMWKYPNFIITFIKCCQFFIQIQITSILYQFLLNI